MIQKAPLNYKKGFLILTDISSPSEITGPLSSFQHTKFSKEELLKLCKTINNRIKDNKGGKPLSEKSLEDVFEVFFPKLEIKINQILSSNENQEDTVPYLRTDRDLLEELVENQRLLKEKLNDVWTNKEVDEIITHYVKKFLEDILIVVMHAK